MSKTAYTVDEAAAEVGLRPTAIRDAIDKLTLPARRHGGKDDKGGRLVILHSDLEAWLKGLPPARS